MTKDLRLALVVNPELPLGLLANTTAAISIGMGTRMPDLGDRRLSDAKGTEFDSSSNLPVPVLQASDEQLRQILTKASGQIDKGSVVAFPAFARKLHAYEDYLTALPEKDLSAEAIDGIGLAGPAKWVRSLTGSLKLLR